MANVGTAASGALSGAASGAVVGGPVGAGIGGAIGLLGGLFGGGDDKSAEYIQKALDQYNGLDGKQPDLKKALALQQFTQGGQLTPELLQHLNLNGDKATNLIENPEDRANQQSSLEALKQLSQTGMSAQDLAQMQAMRSSVAEDTQAKVQSLLQQQQQRGQADSGSTLAAQLSAVQNGSQQASHDAVQQAAAAANSRQQALSQYANLASQIRGEDYNTQKANTDNEIQRQRFLDQNSLSRQQGNVSSSNNANLYNLQRAQSASDSNVGQYNQEQARQVAAKQQEYQNALALAQSKANAYSQQASNSATNAANATQNFSNVANGVGQLAVAGKKAGAWDGLFGGAKESAPDGNPDITPTKNSQYQTFTP